MAEKDKGQTVVPKDAEPEGPTPTDAVPEPKPKEPPAPTIPKEYEGKTLEEMIQMDQESQKTLGGQAKQIGDLKNNLAYSDQLRELAMQRAREGSQAVQQTEQPAPDWNFEKPIESVQEIVKRELDTREQKRQQNDLQRVKDEAKSNYAEGRSLAMKQSPELFEGIERETEDAVYNSYMTGIIGAHALRNPEAWTMAAKMIHLRDNRIDRLQSVGVKPVETVGGELPTPAKPGTTEKPFTGLDYTDEETQKMMKQYGLTKEEAEEIVKEGQERVARGEK